MRKHSNITLVLIVIFLKSSIYQTHLYKFCSEFRWLLKKISFRPLPHGTLLPPTLVKTLRSLQNNINSNISGLRWSYFVVLRGRPPVDEGSGKGLVFYKNFIGVSYSEYPNKIGLQWTDLFNLLRSITQ